MAYALVAGMPAINGLYMAFYPVLVYIVFCTSRHNSMGECSDERVLTRETPL
jgi:solute carrier family 26 protein